MEAIILENIVHIAVTLLLTLIGVAGTWLTGKIAKRAELQNVAAATDEVIKAAQLTVMELQQTVVEGLKKSHADGKLTKEEVSELGQLLLDRTMEKMSNSTTALLNGAGVDIAAIIKGAGEALILRMK